ERNKVQDLFRNRVDAGGWDLVAERRALPRIRIGGRVVDRHAEAAKVAVAHRRRRHGFDAEAAGALARPFPGAEEEELVTLDRPAERATVNVGNALVQLRGSVEEVFGVEVLVVMESESRTVKLVGAGLGLDGDRRAASHPLFRVVAVGGDAHLL